MPKKKSVRWGLVRCAGGAPILALLDGRRWQGWCVPWFPDASVERLAAAYFKDAEPERAPVPAQSGEWEYMDDDDEWVALPRFRKTVVIGRWRGPMALSDSADMYWCFEECGNAAGVQAALDQLLEEARGASDDDADE